MDLTLWYDSAFGLPIARVQGLRPGGCFPAYPHANQDKQLEYERDPHADDRTWPLDDVLYLDATHEVVVLNSRSRARS